MSEWWDRECDVLVVGGGGAGLLAALKSHETGAETLIASKTPLGMGSATTYAGGGFTLAAAGWSKEEHEGATLAAGKGLCDREKVKYFVEEAPAALDDLKSYGVDFRLREGGASVRHNAPGPMLGGMGLTKPLTEAVKKREIGVWAPAMVTDLLFAGEGAGLCGVRLWCEREESYFFVKTPAVILATGGFGGIYNFTDNPVHTTGDGLALYLRSGGRVRNLEFVQFYPLGFDVAGRAPWFAGLHLADKVPLTDGKGEPFFDNLLDEWGLESGAEANLFARDKAARAIAEQNIYGDGAYLRVDRLSRKEAERILPASITRFLEPGEEGDYVPIPVRPIQHFCCGGIPSDLQGKTEVEGVYVAGEVTTNLHGANRVGGNALTELAVFAPAAGKAAARFASDKGDIGVPQGKPRIDYSDKAVGGQIRRVLGELCDTYLGPLRNETGLRALVTELGHLRTDRENYITSAENPEQVTASHEWDNAFIIAEAAARAALYRRESRGTHYREDFPRRKGGWEAYVDVSGGETHISARGPETDFTVEKSDLEGE